MGYFLFFHILFDRLKQEIKHTTNCDKKSITINQSIMLTQIDGLLDGASISKIDSFDLNKCFSFQSNQGREQHNNTNTQWHLIQDLNNYLLC